MFQSGQSFGHLTWMHINTCAHAHTQIGGLEFFKIQLTCECLTRPQIPSQVILALWHYISSLVKRKTQNSNKLLHEVPSSWQQTLQFSRDN